MLQQENAVSCFGQNVPQGLRCWGEFCRSRRVLRFSSVGFRDLPGSLEGGRVGRCVRVPRFGATAAWLGPSLLRSSLVSTKGRAARWLPDRVATSRWC